MSLGAASVIMSRNLMKSNKKNNKEEEELERLVSLGSPSACLELGDKRSKPKSKSLSSSSSCESAALLYFAGLVWISRPGPIGADVAIEADRLEHVATLLSQRLSHLLKSTTSSKIRLSPDQEFPRLLTSSPYHRSSLMTAASSLGWTEEHPFVHLSVFASVDPKQRPSSRSSASFGVVHSKQSEDSNINRLSSSSTSSPNTTSSLSLHGSTEDNSAPSSVPSSPLTRSNNETMLNDSPLTTPSLTSSSESVSKTFAPHTYRNLLQEHLALRLDTQNIGRNSSSSGASTPLSIRSTTSVRSTASSIFAKMCGTIKTSPSTTVFAEQKSTMGSFTPFSASTAASSLRRLGGHQRRSSTFTVSASVRPHDRSRLGVPVNWDPTDSDSDTNYPKPIPKRLHARSATTDGLPAISLTHSSFKDESMLLTSPTALMDSLPVRAHLPKKSLDPALAALEKQCKLKSKVTCYACGKAGWDFPKNRVGQALCSRECRVGIKERENGKGKGVAIV